MKNHRHLLTGSCLAVILVLATWPAVNAQAPGNCSELIVNGDFEGAAAWQFGITQLTPEYVSYARHSGNRSLAMGITRGGNRAGYSSVRQSVSIPAAMTNVTLSFWFYAMVEGNAKGDQMELVLLDPSGAILATPWQSSNDSRTWNKMTLDLTRWRGRTIQIYFSVYNDGTGGTAGLFLDDVSLVACPGMPLSPMPPPSRTLSPVLPTRTATSTAMPPAPFPSPTRTALRTVTATATLAPPAATATPSPTMGAAPIACIDLLRNGDFEDGLTWWQASAVALPIRAVTSPVHGGAYAIRLGTQEDNLNSYSSMRQIVALPPISQRVTLEFWVSTWAESSTGSDRQEVIIFAADGSRLASPWRALVNDPTWRKYNFDLAGYGGQTISIYFNVYNDGVGGKTAMFVDDVHLLACDAYAPAVLPDVGPVDMIPWPAELLDPSLVPAVGAASSGTAATPTPRTTRVALAVTDLPPTAVPVTTAAPTPTPALAPALVATPARSEPAAPIASQVVGTWQSRWWVVVLTFVLLAGLAIVLGLAFGKTRR